jgi:hypothetical protein
MIPLLAVKEEINSALIKSDGKRHKRTRMFGFLLLTWHFDFSNMFLRKQNLGDSKVKNNSLTLW